MSDLSDIKCWVSNDTVNGLKEQLARLRTEHAAMFSVLSRIEADYDARYGDDGIEERNAFAAEVLCELADFRTMIAKREQG